MMSVVVPFSRARQWCCLNCATTGVGTQWVVHADAITDKCLSFGSEQCSDYDGWEGFHCVLIQADQDLGTKIFSSKMPKTAVVIIFMFSITFWRGPA